MVTWGQISVRLLLPLLIFHLLKCTLQLKVRKAKPCINDSLFCDTWTFMNVYPFLLPTSYTSNTENTVSWEHSPEIGTFWLSDKEVDNASMDNLAVLGRVCGRCSMVACMAFPMQEPCNSPVPAILPPASRGNHPSLSQCSWSLNPYRGRVFNQFDWQVMKVHQVPGAVLTNAELPGWGSLSMTNEEDRNTSREPDFPTKCITYKK